ncbi:hypothetical protein C8Q76DRAFT_265819 [Earliella scabrosa]|nr:hypothetical protein C8Q76DRAFT_265819 [Earliella scabrosa]
MAPQFPDNALVYTPNGWPYKAVEGSEEWYVFQRPLGVPLELPNPPSMSNANDFPVGSVMFKEDTLIYWKVTDGWIIGDEVKKEDYPTYAPALERLFVVEQDRYQYGEIPAHAEVVSFNVPIREAEAGSVRDSDLPAFSADLAKQEKYTIRVCLPGSSYQPKQRNRRLKHRSITREQLARDVAEEVKTAVSHLEGGLRVGDISIEASDLVLVDVRWVSRGSVQPTLALRYNSYW